MRIAVRDIEICYGQVLAEVALSFLEPIQDELIGSHVPSISPVAVVASIG